MTQKKQKVKLHFKEIAFGTADEASLHAYPGNTGMQFHWLRSYFCGMQQIASKS